LVHLDPDLTGDEPAIQPLSSRELEVLQYLATGLTNRQIAEQMVVTINTVKAHTRRLYAKLDVSNRTQAVARARQLQLL
jgi:LuxR family maltose regulon positive regulatory protein